MQPENILITGGTGAVGISVTRAFIERGIRPTVLVRARPDVKERLTRAFGTDIPHMVGDVTEMLCGVSVEAHSVRPGMFDAVVHIAGKTQYHERLREDTFKANVEGTRNVLALASQLEIPRLVFTSTSYVAGAKPFLGEEERGQIDLANNPYEASKITAERCIADTWLDEAAVLRLSTVMGDSRSGFIAGVGGYAAFARALWVYRKKMEGYAKNPFYVGVNPSSTLNLVPIDWVAGLIVSATLAKGLVGTFHLTHPKPVNLGFLFEHTFRRGFNLPLTCDKEEADRTALWPDPKWRKIQEAISLHIVGYFRPYVWRDTTWEHRRVLTIPGYASPPPVTEGVIERQVAYMREHLFPAAHDVELATAL